MKTLFKLVFFFGLIAAIFGGRWLWYHRGFYTPTEIPSIESLQVSMPTADYRAFTDAPRPGDGRVVIDLAHGNNLLVDDLTPLMDRLAARGVEVVLYDGYDYYLDEILSDATAFVVLAPVYSFYSEEQQAVLDFVEDGGLLLLAADPTRSAPPVPDDWGYIDLSSILFPPSAVPAANSLANQYGLSYYEDYLYNQIDNAGNYRNVKFTKFEAENPLTDGLKLLIFEAAHSIKGDGTPLILADSNTLSNFRTGETGLTPAIQTAEGRVLALGDVTFLIPPANRLADNDHFLSNIADWLSKDGRDWDLADYPYLFKRPVDLVQTLETVLNPDVLDLVSPLQYTFDSAGMTLEIHDEPQSGSDAIFVGLFDKLDPVQDYLDQAGVSIIVSDTEKTDSEATGDGEKEEPKPDTIIVEGLGKYTTSGMAVFVVEKDAAQTTLVILAEDDYNLSLALDVLSYMDFSGCVSHVAVMLCPVGDYTPPVEDVGSIDTGGDTSTLGKIFILAIDDGADGARSGAPELESAMFGLYDVTVWYTSLSGYPTADDLTGYDAYIIESGDYAYEMTDARTQAESAMIFSGKGVAYIGEQVGSSDGLTLDPAPLVDLTVADSLNPLAFGFLDGDTITLAESVSGIPATVFSQADFAGITTEIAFNRGPDSPQSGNPAVFTLEDADFGYRVAFVGFAFYRMPSEYQWMFAWNLADWLLGD